MVQGWIQIVVFCAVVFACVPLLGGYMARVFTNERVFLTPVVGPLERLVYRTLRVDVAKSQGWKSYAGTLLVFSALFWLALYLILRTQTLHPWNPNGFHSGTWDVTFNTVSSFITNTNWQYYGGETTMSYFSQMGGLAVQNFVSAAVGIVVAIALIRGIAARRSGAGVAAAGLGNFWQDLTRALLYVLLPISVVGALVLASQGVVQSLGNWGPVASQEIIKQLGTNGGGFFNVNSAMPFENANGLTNFLEMLAIIVIPASLTYTYGRMVGSRRQGWTIFGAMFVLFAISVAVVYIAEYNPTPASSRWSTSPTVRASSAASAPASTRCCSTRCSPSSSAA
jgi:K+-transporting ATPase ATPase A chain